MSNSKKQMIERAVSLLRAGLLPSNLPARLMAEFGLSPGQAQQIAAAALRRRQQQQAKKPVDK